MRPDSNKTFTLDDWRRGDPITARHFQQPITALKKLTSGVALPRQRPGVFPAKAGAAGAAGENGVLTWVNFCIVVDSAIKPFQHEANLAIRIVDRIHDHVPGQAPGVGSTRFYARAAANTRLIRGGPVMSWEDWIPYRASVVPLTGPKLKLTEGQSRKMCMVVNAGKYIRHNLSKGSVDILVAEWVQPLRSPAL